MGGMYVLFGMWGGFGVVAWVGWVDEMVGVCNGWGRLGDVVVCCCVRRGFVVRGMVDLESWRREGVCWLLGGNGTAVRHSGKEVEYRNYLATLMY